MSVDAMDRAEAAGDRPVPKWLEYVARSMAQLWYPSVEEPAAETISASIDRYWRETLDEMKRKGSPGTSVVPPYTEPTIVEMLPVHRLRFIADAAHKTFPGACNHSTFFAIKHFGLDTTGWDVLASWQALHATSLGWEVVSPEVAQQKADAGRLVIAALPALNQSGHTAIVMPQIPPASVQPSGQVPGAFCPLVGGGSTRQDISRRHGQGANWIFGVSPRPLEKIQHAPMLYVRYFLAPAKG
jgi:hypothetical protein